MWFFWSDAREVNARLECSVRWCEDKDSNEDDFGQIRRSTLTVNNTF